MPRIGDPAAAERGLVRWSRLPDPLAGLPPRAGGIDAERLLAAVFGNSPYLSEALLAEPDILGALLQRRAGCDRGRRCSRSCRPSLASGVPD